MPEPSRRHPAIVVIDDERVVPSAIARDLVRRREIVPKARRVLLAAYGDADVAIRAIDEVSLDCWLLLKPVTLSAKEATT